MKLLTPSIFEPFPEVIASISLRDENYPKQLSMANPGPASDSQEVAENRVKFAKELGFDQDRLMLLKQVHSSKIVEVTQTHKGNEIRLEGDALVCSEPGLLLGVTVADCVPVLVYDSRSGCYAAIHSGWKGSTQNISGLTIDVLSRNYGSLPDDLYAWIGPAAGANSYEVGYDVVSQFNPIYSQAAEEDRWLFDNKSVVRDQLRDAGIPESQIEISTLDTISNQELHSARRDGEESGRMLAAIGVTAR